MRERRGERTRRAILEAAENLFADQGFAETRLEDVAKAVGIRRSSLIYYFPTKPDLYDALLATVLGELLARTQNRHHRFSRSARSCMNRLSHCRRIRLNTNGACVIPGSHEEGQVGTKEPLDEQLKCQPEPPADDTHAEDDRHEEHACRLRQLAKVIQPDRLVDDGYGEAQRKHQKESLRPMQLDR